jgi:4-aminobutyrate aminotransferase-like enzyme
LKRRYDCIGDVRGLGVMVGVEFVTPGGADPDHPRAKHVQAFCKEHGLLLLTCGTYDNVIRWIPPLVVEEQEMHDALQVSEAAVASLQ